MILKDKCFRIECAIFLHCADERFFASLSPVSPQCKLKVKRDNHDFFNISVVGITYL